MAGKTVWVVDDEPDVLTYLVVALEDAGFDVRAFPSADRFLDYALASPPDLICLDIMMPKQSGLSLYKDLRRTDDLGGIPIVIVSGYSRQEEFLDDEFRRLVGDEDVPEPDGYVEKPVRISEFITMVAELAGEESG